MSCFFDESIQKILKAANVLDLFCEYVKYPRTYHLPRSESVNSDDRMIQSLDGFIGKRIIVTEKMDGENTSMYKDYIHARSVDGRNHPSRNWVKQFWSKISGDIPSGWRVCGENLYAEHSIKYDNLQSYFMGFSIWNEKNICLSWDETQEWFKLLGICSVKTLYDGSFDESLIKELWDSKNSERSEGYVVRVADEIAYAPFNKLVAKFVRKNHVQTVKHWMYGQPIKPNGILK